MSGNLGLLERRAVGLRAGLLSLSPAESAATFAELPLARWADWMALAADQCAVFAPLGRLQSVG